MQATILEAQQPVERNEQELLELNELQLALVGGGLADVVFG